MWGKYMNRSVRGKCRKKYRTLAIIGNGFDLAHHYATDYNSFVKATSSKSLDVFKEYCAQNNSITTWYLFEDNINRLTQELFLQSYSKDHDYESVKQNRSCLRDVFADVHNLLIHYLRQETERKPVVKLSSIKRYLKRKTMAITFNYTKIASAYACDVFHVHGSLAENDILLGYDYRDEACLAEYEDMCWGKDICREALAFRRYLKNELQLQPGTAEYDERIDGLAAYQHYINSGRGLDEEVESFIPHYQLVSQFIQANRNGGDIPQIDYSKIATVVIMGHGIEADRVFLQKIIKKCPHIKKVIIFRYAGEDDTSFNAKVDFFKPYCKKIRSVIY